MRAACPRDVKAEVDRAIAAVNESDPAAARAAFAQANAAFDERTSEREAAASQDRIEQARLKNAEAALLYPIDLSKAEPLLCQAAELAATEIWFWIECGQARQDRGHVDTALAAFQQAHELAERAKSERDVAAASTLLGYVRVDQGDLPGALDA